MDWSIPTNPAGRPARVVEAEGTGATQRGVSRQAQARPAPLVSRHLPDPSATSLSRPRGPVPGVPGSRITAPEVAPALGPTLGAGAVDWLVMNFSADDLELAAVRARALLSHAEMAPALAPSPGVMTRGQERRLIPPEHLAAQAEASRRLAQRLADADVTMLPNAGGHQNQCLLVAMAQVAGVEPAQVEAGASLLGERLALRPDALGAALREGQGLHADRGIFAALAREVFGPAGIPPLFILQASAGGAPQLFAPLGEQAVDIAQVPHHAAVILESPGHFHALANVSGRPWSQVLACLSDPDPALGAYGPRNVRLRVRHSTGIETDMPRWSRGAQVAQVPLHLGPVGAAPSPHALAGAIAEAQTTIDDVWDALDHGRIDLLAIRRSQSGGEIFHLGVSPRDDGGGTPSGGAGANPGDELHQYVALLHVHQAHLLGLTVQSEGEGDVAVEYEHPWSRRQAPLMASGAAQMRLNAALRAHPRRHGLNRIEHARALFEYDRGLTEEALAEASLAHPAQIQSDPVIHPERPVRRQDAELNLALAHTPRAPGEQALPWARRLLAAHPELLPESVVEATQVQPARFWIDVGVRRVLDQRAPHPQAYPR